MFDIIVQWLKGFPKEYLVVIVSALPVAELRGAIPLALSLGMPLSKAFWLAILGNALPVIPLLFFLEPASRRLRRFKTCARFFDWFFKHTEKKADIIQRYEALGLALFVAIPLPMTGAWSGAVAASLFRIKFRYAFAAISAGIIIAGLIVLTFCTLGSASLKAVIH